MPKTQQQQTVQLPKELADANPAAKYEAWQRMRQALNEQVERLNDERETLSETLRQNALNSTVDKGLEARILALDSRVTVMHKEIALVDEQIVRAAALAPDRPQARNTEVGVQQIPPRETFPEELIAIPVMFILCVALPLTIAYSRRIWRKSGEVASTIPKDILDRLTRMDQNIDAIALEVERIGESQRFVAKQQAEHLGIGAGAAEGVDASRIGERERSR